MVREICTLCGDTWVDTFCHIRTWKQSLTLDLCRGEWNKLRLKIWNHMMCQELAGTSYRQIVGFWIHMGSFLQVLAAVFLDSFTNDSILLRDKWCCYANKRVDADFWDLVKYGNWDTNSSNLHRTWSSIDCTQVNLVLSAIVFLSTYSLKGNLIFQWQTEVAELTN